MTAPQHDTAYQGLAGLRVLVTGASGFIGGHVVARLITSGVFQVVGLDLRPLPEWVLPLVRGIDFTFHQRDLLGDVDDILTGADVVIHLAAKVSASLSVKSPLDDAATNINGTLSLLEAMRRSGVRRIVYASSAAVYGSPRYVPVDEEHPTVPESPYGLSKLTAERYALLYGRLHRFSVASLRFFNVFGPHQPLRSGYSGVITLFLDQVQRGVPLTIEGDGSHTRDFIHVEDVARAVVLAATQGYEGTINIGTGVAISIHDLARLVGGPDWPITYLPPRPGDIPHSVAATRGASEGIGFRAEISVADGLAKLARLQN